MNITHLKKPVIRKSRCFIGLIVFVLMFAPMSNLFADTMVCVNDATSSMDMMDHTAMDADMDCCDKMDMCKAACDLSMFSAPMLLDSTSAIAFIKPDVRYLAYQTDLLPYLPPPPLIRPPVSV
jgi:hypothetical protein